MDTPRPSPEDEVMVHITTDDLWAARDAWRRARARGAVPRRIAQLHDDYDRLVDAQARQTTNLRRPPRGD
jgi:hypothetical protein